MTLTASQDARLQGEILTVLVEYLESSAASESSLDLRSRLAALLYQLGVYSWPPAAEDVAWLRARGLCFREPPADVDPATIARQDAVEDLAEDEP